MRVKDLLHILGRFIYNICKNLKLWTLVFPVWLLNDTINLIFMWLILIIFGVLRKNREIPNSMSCTDNKRVLFLESISTLIIKTENKMF